ncbi:MAG: LD-carboxypeptidase [Thermonemataceae bacterium]|nr:LD-carboxypeptidase [Thermonemataceae bacterium]
MIYPKKLSPKAKVGIVAPASVVEPQHIEFGIQLLESWGFEVVLGKNIFNKNTQFAGTWQERLSDFQYFLDDEEIDAIICARGGYGVVQWIDKADFSRFLQKPKWIVGYSDVTVLHCALQKIGVASLHAPMLKGLENIHLESKELLKQVLFGENIVFYMENSQNHTFGFVEGELIGGNLALLATQIGTKTDFDTKDKIFFIEDTNEPLYNIDRMLRQLQRAAKFEGLRALLVGDFSNIKEENPPFDKNLRQIILDVLGNQPYPIIFDFPIGHSYYNHPLICGAKARIEQQENQVIFRMGTFS